MTTHRIASLRGAAHRAMATTTGALVLAAATVNPASAAIPSQAQPARGAVVRCDHLGALTATSGHLRQRAKTAVDRRGRAHVLFTIRTDHVRLTGAHGTRYRLVGSGFDRVVYPGRSVTGTVLREYERFHFNVVSGGHIVGVVRFQLRTGADQTTQVHDTSTCQLPNMS